MFGRPFGHPFGGICLIKANRKFLGWVLFLSALYCCYWCHCRSSPSHRQTKPKISGFVLVTTGLCRQKGTRSKRHAEARGQKGTQSKRHGVKKCSPGAHQNSGLMSVTTLRLEVVWVLRFMGVRQGPFQSFLTGFAGLKNTFNWLFWGKNLEN